jgi:hypothetical protein
MKTRRQSRTWLGHAQEVHGKLTAPEQSTSGWMQVKQLPITRGAGEGFSLDIPSHRISYIYRAPGRKL